MDRESRGVSGGECRQKQWRKGVLKKKKKKKKNNNNNAMTT
jgi:hypothetical protein